MAQHVHSVRASGPMAGALVVLIGVLLTIPVCGVSAHPAQEPTIRTQAPPVSTQDTTSVDSLPPTGSIEIASGVQITNQTRIQLLLQASDQQNIVDLMEFSDDGENWGPPEPFSTTREWELTGDDGVKTIFVRYRDHARNWMSEGVSVQIILDRQPPQRPSLRINDGSQLTNDREVQLRLSAEGASQAEASEDSSFSSATWQPAEELKSFRLSPDDGEKVVFARFRDEAGNVSTIASAHIVLDTTPPFNPTIVVNEGDRYTNRRDVQVELSADEADEMKVAQGEVVDAPWQPLDSLVTLSLQGPEGEQIVLARFRDRAGNETETVAASIVLDQTPPQNPQLVIAGGRGFVNAPEVVLSLSAIGASEMILAGDFAATPPDSGWGRYRNQMTVQLTEGENVKRLWVRYRDEAGNISEIAANQVVLDMTPPTITSLTAEEVQPRFADLGWETNELTTASIKIVDGLAGVERSIVDSTNSVVHHVNVADLAPGNPYEVTLKAVDRAGNASAGKELAFVTLSDAIVHGRVVYPHTQIPVVGVEAQLGEMVTESDTSGHFEFVHPHVGEQSFVLEADGYDTHDGTLEVPKSGEVEKVIELASPVYTHSVAGTVSNRRGEPLGDTRVVLFNPDGSESELSTATDDSGRYVLPGVPQGTRQLRFFCDYFEPVEPEMEIADDTKLDESLSATPIHPPNRTDGTPRSIRSIEIEWEPIGYPTVMGYVIYRAPSPDSEFVAINEGYLPPTQDAFVDSGLSIGTRYTYSIAVANIDTVFGERSAELTSATLDLFAPNQTFVFGIQRPLAHAAPALVDLDGDGDLDLLLAEGSGSVRGYRNTGSPSMPRWERDDGLSDGIMVVGGNSNVAMGDLDGDLDPDLLRGIGDGRFRGYRNTGSPEAPQWSPDAELSEGVKENGRNLSPALVDLDADGDLDLVIGHARPELVSYENIGAPDRPSWRVTERFGEGLSDLPMNPSPLLADLDGDGDLDLLVGEGLGSVIAFENTGSPEAPRWRVSREFSTGIGDVGDLAVPTVGDLDGDGDLDLLVGSWNGKVFGFENNTIASVRVLAGVKALK